MNKSSFDKGSSKSGKTKKRFSKFKSFIILGAITIAVIGFGVLVSTDSSTTSAQAKPGKDGKKYIATKKIIVDRQTGEVRKPNEKELTDLVDNLSAMTRRSPENLGSASLANGNGVKMDLEGGFGGTMLARPNGDGTMETKCVFTFEEAAEFLGLEEENPTE